MKSVELCSVTACLSLATKVLQSFQIEDLTLTKIKTRSITKEVSAKYEWQSRVGYAPVQAPGWHSGSDGLMETHTGKSLKTLFS